jgi:hypothetical protein
MTRLAFLLAVFLCSSGCGSRRPEADIERGRAAVAAALDGWKANDPPGKLKSLPDPVDFTEELRATHALTDYTLGKADTSDKEVIRYTVTLKLKDKKGKPTDREVVYAVALKTPVVVSRDPYY